MQPSIQTHHANCLCFDFGANMCKHKEALAHIDSKEHLFGLGKDVLRHNPALRACNSASLLLLSTPQTDMIYWMYWD